MTGAGGSECLRGDWGGVSTEAMGSDAARFREFSGKSSWGDDDWGLESSLSSSWSELVGDSSSSLSLGLFPARKKEEEEIQRFCLGGSQKEGKPRSLLTPRSMAFPILLERLPVDLSDTKKKTWINIFSHNKKNLSKLPFGSTSGFEGGRELKLDTDPCRFPAPSLSFLTFKLSFQESDWEKRIIIIK